MQFAGESILTALACALHGFYLYSGYSRVAAEGISTSLNDPLWSFFELRVGSGIPALPLTGPIFYLCSVYFLSWGTRAYTAAGGRLPALTGVMAAYNLYATLLSLTMFVLFVAQFAQHTPGLTLLTYKLPQGAAMNLWAAAMWVNYQSSALASTSSPPPRPLCPQTH